MPIKAADWLRRRITELADEYRARGYSVAIEPRLDDLPSFIKPYRPDLIARGQNENVVIEVKSRKGTSGEVVDLAERIKGQPGWRFEVVFVEPSETSTSEDLLSVDELQRNLLEAERLREAGLLAPAFLVAWAATEGALRHAVRRQGISDEQFPLRLLRQVTSLGVITQSDLRFLERCMEIRNRVAHGFQPEPLDSQLLSQLASLAQRLLEAGETIDDGFSFLNVSHWVEQVLSTYQGYSLEDEIFGHDTVFVRAKDGARFPITMESWSDIDDSDRLSHLRGAIKAWAADHLQGKHP